ncbi:hypothetical protein [Streptomyces albipurpureus]|uniref:Amidohydrolase family protein n=1 Tax=Streptomyces albipurpureus TaxID=2897419 RepID=A0ABT0UFX8_9ACTN|nr:hypothetical protein [Streptomyces sp. CWNU-1]MCM2387537.1 hypothetical protein [Streptomyces sp. CWNU-1]
MANRLLIGAGFVVSRDPAIGNRPETDILVEDGKIVAVAPGLDTVDAEVVDATGTVVIPGFVDTHRHTWEAATRGLLPSCTVDQYLGAMIATLGPAYRSHKVTRPVGLLGGLVTVAWAIPPVGPETDRSGGYRSESQGCPGCTRASSSARVTR